MLRLRPLVSLVPVLLLSASLFVTTAAGEEPPRAPAAGAMERTIRLFAADETSLRRFYTEPLSELRLERLTRFLERWRAALAAVAFDALGVTDRIDYVLLRNHIEKRADALALQRERNAETLALLPAGILQLERSRWRPAQGSSARRFADALVEIRRELGARRAAVEAAHDAKGGAPPGAPRLTPVIAFRTSKALERLKGVLAGWYGFHESFDPGFAWWVKQPYDALRKDMDGYARFLRETVAGAKRDGAEPLIGDPIGREALCRALAREMIPYSPAQLLAIAEQEFAWCEQQGAKAAKELGLDHWSAAVEHVKGLHREPGEQPRLVAAQGEEAVAFLAARDLVTVPPLCAETWRLRMLSQRSQKTLPFAVYNDQHMLVAYATSGMAHDAKLMSMRGNNEHFTRLVTPHELIPGHHLQLFQAARHRAYREVFRTPFFVEGWALHWEMLLWDLGWHRNAADRVGMLFWRMHRCARIIVTLGFHLGTLEPSAMVDFLVERVGLERDGATGEVRRYVGGAYGPLYQCAYMLGGLQLRALHHDLVGNGTLSNRAFHDAVLRQGSIPMELVRAALTGQRLDRDHRAAWPWRGDVAVDGAPCPR